MEIRSARLIQKAGLPKAIYWAAVLYFAFTPVWGAYAKHAFKDTLGAAVFGFYIVTLIALIKAIRAGGDRYRYYILNGAAGCLAALVRNNFIYCILPAVVLLVPVARKYKVRLYKILTLAALISCYFLFNFYFFHYAGVAKGSPAEALSVPLQQMARTIRDHPSELSPEELAEIGEFVTPNQAAQYDPIISDPIKGHMPTGVGNLGAREFVRVWLKYFGKYPAPHTPGLLSFSVYGLLQGSPRLP